MGEQGDEPVVVAADEVHGIDDTREGMKPAFLALAGLLVADLDPDHRSRASPARSPASAASNGSAASVTLRSHERAGVRS